MPPSLAVQHFLQDVPNAAEQRMHAQRHAERKAGSFDIAVTAQDFSKAAHRAKMPGFDFERAVYCCDTFVVAFQHVKEGCALVPGFGPIRTTPEQDGKTRFGDVVAPRGNVNGGALQRKLGALVIVVHPYIPDRVFDAGSFGGAAAGVQFVKQLVQTRGQGSRWLPLRQPTHELERLGVEQCGCWEPCSTLCSV